MPIGEAQAQSIFEEVYGWLCGAVADRCTDADHREVMVASLLKVASMLAAEMGVNPEGWRMLAWSAWKQEQLERFQDKIDEVAARNAAGAVFWRVKAPVDDPAACVAVMVNARGEAHGNCGPVRTGEGARDRAEADGRASGLPEWRVKRP